MQIRKHPPEESAEGETSADGETIEALRPLSAGARPRYLVSTDQIAPLPVTELAQLFHDLHSGPTIHDRGARWRSKPAAARPPKSTTGAKPEVGRRDRRGDEDPAEPAKKKQKTLPTPQSKKEDNHKNGEETPSEAGRANKIRRIERSEKGGGAIDENVARENRPNRLGQASQAQGGQPTQQRRVTRQTSREPQQPEVFTESNRENPSESFNGLKSGDGPAETPSLQQQNPPNSGNDRNIPPGSGVITNEQIANGQQRPTIPGQTRQQRPQWAGWSYQQLQHMLTDIKIAGYAQAQLQINGQRQRYPPDRVLTATNNMPSILPGYLSGSWVVPKWSLGGT